MLIVFTTCPDLKEAESLARSIVDHGLAACVQVMPPITSFYVWEGAVQKEPEHLLLVKTLPEKWDDLRSFILENHSYSVPEIVGVEANRVSEGYLNWMQEVLTS